MFVGVCRSGTEFKIRDDAEASGFSVVIPEFRKTVSPRHVKGDRVVIEPQFPGYCFLDHGVLDHYNTFMRKCQTFWGIVRFGDTLAEVREEEFVKVIEIDARQKGDSSFHKGDRVVAEVAGIETKGTYLSEDFIEVELFGRVTKAKIDWRKLKKLV